MRSFLLPVGGVCAALVLAAGCSSTDEAPAAVPTASIDPAVDAPAPPLEGPRHFPVGATFALPEGSFALVAAPAGNLNRLFVEAGRSLFVPHVAGDYTFRASSGAELVMTAVPASTLAFHNHNYFPTRAVDVEGDALWVASVLRPEILRVDRASLATVATIPTGSWPVAVESVPSRKLVIVAARGDDTLTLVDTETARPTRSVFVGDEVSNVVVSPSGALAVALAPTDQEAVFVDLDTLAVVARVPVGTDPAYAAFSPDGKKVYVAGRKTGRHEATDRGVSPDPIGADLSEIDVATKKVTRTVEEVGTTLGGLAVSEAGDRLFVVGVRSDPSASLANPSGGQFPHTVAVYDLSSPAIAELASRDITLQFSPGAPQPLASRRAVSLHSPSIAGGSLWVVAEASDLVLELDPTSLAEKARFEAVGRPRSLAVAPDGKVYAFGHQAQSVTEVSPRDGALRAQAIETDPRDEAIARGQRFFTGTGTYTPVGAPTAGLAVAGDRWSCASCHADGLGDKLVWQAGPGHRAASRPYVMLEGTFPLGWQGYLSDIRNYSYSVTGNVGVVSPTTEIVTGLDAYLTSVMPPPAANSLTARDGRLSEAALRGKALFDEHCASCHAGALTTSRARIEPSIPGSARADVPALLGVYRTGTHFRFGTAKSIAQAVDVMITFAGAELAAPERSDLVRYVSELTGRDFFPIAEYPRASRPLGTLPSIEVAFSLPVLAEAKNLEKVRLVDAAGAPVPAKVTAAGRRVRIVPTSRLAPEAEVTVVVDSGLVSERDVATPAQTEITYRTASRAELRLDGAYTFTYALPSNFGPPGGSPPKDGVIELTFAPNQDGSSKVTARFPNAPAVWTGEVVVSGRVAYVPPMPLPAGNAFAEGSSGFVAELVDEDGDGIADAVSTGPSGAGRGYTMSGPGFEVKGLAWALVRKK